MTLVRVMAFGVLASVGPASHAQLPPSPEHGFQPAGSYALSNIESINTANGNMIVTVPLASLPAGRGGSPGFQLTLTHNSKLYDTYMVDVPDPVTGQPAKYIFLNPSEQGGWHYNVSPFTLQLINRLDVEGGTQCIPGQCGAHLLKNTYIYKLKVIFPDSGEHEFRPLGYTDYFGDGYYDTSPNGLQWGSTCNSFECTISSSQATTSGMTYYSTDGSFMRLDIAYNPNGGWGDWTLSFPDGRRVVYAGGVQRTYDRNNNYTEIQFITYNGHYANKVVDQLGRSIIIEYDGAAARDYIHVTGANGEQAMSTVKWKTIYAYKPYRGTPSGDQRGNYYPTTGSNTPLVVDQIILPSQAGALAYTFGYNAPDTDPYPNYSYGWGEISSITLPSGAQATYAWTFDGPGAPQPPRVDWVLQAAPTRKDLIYNAEYDGATTAITDTWTYSAPMNYGTVMTITGPDGGVTRNYSDSGGAFARVSYKTENPDGSVIERTWQHNIPYQNPPMNSAVNPYVKTEFISIKDATGNLSLTAIKDYNYDKNGNVTQVKEYDRLAYASVHPGGGEPIIPAGAQPKRITVNAFFNPTPDASDNSYSPYVYNQPSAAQTRNVIGSTEIRDNSQTLARAEFAYDNTSTTANLTEQKRWDSSKGAYSNPLTTGNSISASTQYNLYGSPILTTDARGIQTQFTYGNVGGLVDLYPTQIKTSYQTSVQRTETREYDVNTGIVTRGTDVDNNVSTSSTFDVFGRPLLVKAAEGKPEETRTRTEYSDSLRRVIVRSDLNAVGDEKLVAIKHFDQLGRLRLARQLEDPATQSATDETQGIKVQTRYVFCSTIGTAQCPNSNSATAGSYTLVSNPYRAAYSSTAGAEGTMGWTRNRIDNGGRMVEVQTFGTVGLPAPWGANTTSTGTVITAYDANLTTVTDQAGKLRRSTSDAFGRLTRVDEPDASAGNLDDANGDPVQPTFYTYDSLGNLRQVLQGQQQRFFMYDSLSRLIRVANPEQQVNPNLAVTDPITNNSQWCMAYDHDENGNLLHRTDARGVVSTLTYDLLNRNLGVTYTNDPANTPAIIRSYDGATFGKGRLWSTYTSGVSGSRTTIDTYDALGRPKAVRQQFFTGSDWGQSFTEALTYDLAGHVLTHVYPSQRTVAYAYDGTGRANSFSGDLGDGTNRTYSSGISYSPLGGMSQEQFGTNTPIYNKLFYNSRGQLAEIREGLEPNNTGWERGAIINHYSNQGGCWGASCNASDNNGNLRRQEVHIPNTDNFAQFYEYDALNRLQSVRENRNGGPVNWQQAYTYDRYGNRSINAGATWGQLINSMQSAVVPNTMTNRIYAPGETEQNHPLTNYDAAGNQTKDYYSDPNNIDYDRTYDAENRMNASTATDIYGSRVSNYTYDSNGRRVLRNVNGTVTWQIYGVQGELLAEYAADANPLNPQKEYGYRNGQLLIVATAPSGLAVNSSPQTGEKSNTSEASNAETITAESSNDLLASNKTIGWPQGAGISGTAQANIDAISDTSTPLYGPIFPYASLRNSFAPLAPQSGSAKIAFASNRDGSAQIYSMNSDGSGLVSLTADVANNEAPNWSPDNSRIVFQSDRDNLFSFSYDIYVMNWDGSGQVRLTSGAADDSAPVWSPDGTKIAFQSARNGVNYQVYVMNADGTGQVNISNTTANDTQPSWSADGTKIAFASDRDQPAYSSVYVMNANGSGQTRLTVSGAGLRDEQPAWSPDGSKLTFTSTRDSIVVTWQETDDEGGVIVKTALQVNKEVYSMNANGTAQTRLTNILENDDSASWSADGTKIVFRSDRERDCCDPTPQVWVMNGDGSGPINLSNNGYVEHCPSWQHAAANLPPTVNLTSPANGAVFTAPASVTVSANASDSDGTISRVDFYQGTTLIGTDTVAPYSFNWSNVAAGSYSLTARAIDNVGGTSTSAAVNIVVNAIPSVSITSPANGTGFTAPANVTISANATDSDGTISKVDFYQGTTLIDTDTTAPYSFAWNNVAAGNYSLTAKATDNVGASSTSAVVSITVNALPSVSLTAPANGAAFTAPANITISANASDPNGSISSVQFYQGTTLIGTDTTAPYSIVWNSVAAGNYSLTAKATDNSGATNTSGAIAISVNANGAPAVNVVTPSDGSNFATPANLTISANATDSDGTIISVEFYQGMTVIGTDTTAPYSLDWNNVASGSYSLTAKATDNSGATSTSTPISITVNNEPTVSIMSPANGSSFTGPSNITIDASANDNDGSISQIEFYQGTTLIGTSTASPYSMNWQNVSAGTYSLTARATDNMGATTDSNPISITVTNPPAVADIRWIVTDQLGTPRMTFDETGSLSGVARHDYLPFGEELTAGGRMTTPGYGIADGARQKFTSKERDIETGLDYFGARYYSSIQGRFTSADEPFADQRQSNPQSWNSYSYVKNSPCNNTDPNGKCSAPAGMAPGTVGICIEAFIASRRTGPGGVARGDNRTFSGDDPKLTARVRVELLIKPESGGASIQEFTHADTSTVDVPMLFPPGLSIPVRAPGEGNTEISNAQTDKNGTTTFTATTTATSGFSDVPVVGKALDPIESKLNVVVTKDGKVGLNEGSASKNYPSYAAYSYRYDEKGKLVTTRIFIKPEKDLKDLNRPMTPIPKVEPK